MAFYYYKLWMILEDKKIVRQALRLKVDMSFAASAKVGKNKIVSMDVLGRICQPLKYDIRDIVIYVGKKNDKQGIKKTKFSTSYKKNKRKIRK